MPLCRVRDGVRRICTAPPSLFISIRISYLVFICVPYFVRIRQHKIKDSAACNINFELRSYLLHCHASTAPPQHQISLPSFDTNPDFQQLGDGIVKTQYSPKYHVCSLIVFLYVVLIFFCLCLVYGALFYWEHLYPGIYLEINRHKLLVHLPPWPHQHTR